MFKHKKPTQVRILHGILIICTYLLASRFFSYDKKDHIIFINALFCLYFLAQSSLLDVFYRRISGDVKRAGDRDLLIRRLIVLVIWIISLVYISQIKWIGKSVAPSILFFASVAPAIWLFRIRSTTVFQLILGFLFFTTVFASFKLQAANVFAEITYLWIGTSVIMLLSKTA